MQLHASSRQLATTPVPPGCSDPFAAHQSAVGPLGYPGLKASVQLSSSTRSALLELPQPITQEVNLVDACALVQFSHLVGRHGHDAHGAGMLRALRVDGHTH